MSNHTANTENRVPVTDSPFSCITYSSVLSVSPCTKPDELTEIYHNDKEAYHTRMMIVIKEMGHPNHQHK